VKARGRGGVAIALLALTAAILWPEAIGLRPDPGGVFSGVSAQSPPPSAWPQFRNTPALTGVANTTLPTTLKLLWTFEAGGPIESSAAITGDTVYVASNFGELVALDLASGKPKWRYRAVSENLGIAESSPAVAGGTVYIGDLDGMLHAVDAATGGRKWTYKTGGEIKSSPVVVGTRVLIGSYDGALHAVAADTGRPLWKLETDNYVHATPAIWNGVAYFGGCDEFFHGVRVSDGVEVFKLSAEGYSIASPAIVNGVAYWGTYGNEVIAVDIAAKKVIWRFTDPDRQFPFASSAALTNTLVILGGRDKNVRALERAGGKARWAFPTGARVEGSPALAGDKVVVGSGDGKVYMLDVASGKKVWEFNAGSGFTASPAVAGGRIVIGDLDGKVYAFGG
jgi:eukaryotic-like serine/threonine-protein kinase